MGDFVELNQYEYQGVYDPTHPLSRACGNLSTRVESLRAQFHFMAHALDERKVIAHAQWAAARAAVDADEPPGSGATRPQRQPYHAPLAKRPDYVLALSSLREIEAAAADLAGNMVVNLVAAYDTFLAELLRGSFKVRRELLDGSQRQLTYEDVKNLGSIEEARGLVVEREVDDLMHQSRAEQFTTLRRRLTLPLPEKAWQPEVVMCELSERRNLYAHLGGRVSARYLSCSGRHRASAPPVGEKLVTEWGYFTTACDAVISLGIELSQVAWRKLGGKESLGAADRDLAQLTYVMLVREQWRLAEQVLSFAVKLPVHSSEQHHLVFVVNHAQAFKWMGNEAACRQVMSEVDWSAKDYGMQLSAAVLEDNFDNAADLMRDAGQVGHVLQSAFDHWPIYREFRTTPQFAAAYEALYKRRSPPIRAGLDAIPQAERLDPLDQFGEDESGQPSPTP